VSGRGGFLCGWLIDQFGSGGVDRPLSAPYRGGTCFLKAQQRQSPAAVGLDPRRGLGHRAAYRPGLLDSISHRRHEWLGGRRQGAA